MPVQTFPAVRTRSRHLLDPPTRSATPLKLRHAATPVRHPPKRRRLGVVGAATLNRRPGSDADNSDQDSFRFKNRLVTASPRLTVRTRRTAPKLRGKSTFEDEEMASPRKRKRSEESNIPSSDSWIETEDEVPDLIDEGDEHLIKVAPASALHRLRKAELIRLWKVAGMWSSEEDEGMDSDADHGLGKHELVDGLINARKEFSAVGSPYRPKSSSLGAPFTPKDQRSDSTSSLSSPPLTSSPEDESRESRSMDVDATPKAVPRTRLRGRHHPALTEANRKDRIKPKGRNGKARVKRRARFAAAVKSPETTTRRITRRSSTLSSTYTTTDGSDSDEEEWTPVKPTRRYSHVADGLRTPESGPSNNVRATPLIRRLRPRNRSTTSITSTGVDADAEDNADGVDDPPSTRSNSLPPRKAKNEALKALSIDESPVKEPQPKTKSPRRPSRQKSSTSPKSARPKKTANSKNDVEAVEPIEIDDDESVGVMDIRTKRPDKPFHMIQQRRVVESMDDDDTVDTSETEDFLLSHATMASLQRLRREELVHMCESRNLEVGGTKPQLARALLDWQEEQTKLERVSSTSSQVTARAPSPQIVEAVASHVHRDGQTTPVLLREHIHAIDPATPPRSDEESARATENDLFLDLQELGLEDFTIKPENLTKEKKIGSGGFKDVYVGKFKGRKVAIAEFRGHLSEMDIRELKLLADFSHPNIVRFRGICIPEDSSEVPCMLISELCENGDLFDYIRNVPPPPLKRVLRLMLDIARGLEYLHLRKPSIIHRDVKSTNILITRSNVAKVGDFGLARVKNSTRSMIRSLVGTVNWQAPELWHPTPRYDYKVDVFSAALVFWEMLSGWCGGEKKYPWEGHNEHYIYDAVGQKHRRPPLTGLRKYWGAEPVNLIERMWHQDPAERPMMSDVVADLEALIAERR